MSNYTNVTRSKGGTNERVVPVGRIQIPDLWHIVQALKKDNKLQDNPGCAEAILECWSISHDLKNHIEENQKAERS